MGLQVPFAPYLLVFFFFFFRYCNYLFRETQTNKVDKKREFDKRSRNFPINDHLNNSS